MTDGTLRLKILVTPLARGAWFAEALDVARAEFVAHFPDVSVEFEERGGLAFLNAELPRSALPALARLASVQGGFEQLADGLQIVDLDPDFALPDALVWGAKYRGKTNELVTQLAINVALQVSDCDARYPPKLLDPMAGRGTTLLWAARYGIEARGIERDGKALDDLGRHVKRQTKLHRIKHRRAQGFVGRRNRDGLGAFAQYTFGERSLKLVIGDSRDAVELLAGERFTMMVADLPYGVQHVGPGGTRNPLAAIAECAPGWVASLRPGGALVLVFNSLQPRRAELISLFVDHGLVEHPFRAPHRMSESIVRDLAVFTRPR